MNLYIIRHGIASWVPSTFQGDDEQRPLTPEGVKQLMLMGEAMSFLNVRPQFILHSPLLRAADTARHIGKALAIPGRVKAYNPLRPGCDANRLHYLLKEYAHCEELMMVGHMPDVANAVKTLTGGDVKFAEATLALLHVTHPAESPVGTLLWLTPAELMMKIGHSR